MKLKAMFALVVVLSVVLFAGYFTQHKSTIATHDYDVYQYVHQCKAELGITQPLPRLSCLDGTPVPIFVDQQEIKESNWFELLSLGKRCDNPHWLGGDMGCWTYSHLQVRKLDDANILILNCRQKGSQQHKNWFRQTQSNLGMNQAQRKQQFEQGAVLEQSELYYLYNTFNDIGIILRNTQTGKSCYLTQFGKAVAGFLPPLDAPLPSKQDYLKPYKAEQARPPQDFPESLWYRDANDAFRSPEETVKAGCVGCHNAHGLKYSPYINSKQGLPDIRDMAKLPFLPVGKPAQQFIYDNHVLQVTTDPIDGEQQLCTRCHNMTTLGTCGYSIDIATDHPTTALGSWLTLSSRQNWMPPLNLKPSLIKKHVSAMKCCCENPHSKGCLTRKFGPTVNDLPAGFAEGKGWLRGEESSMCDSIENSTQWNGDEIQ